MSGAKRPFLDTNIVVYLLSGEAAKADTAERLVAAGGVVSTQVLNEFVSVARRKIALGWAEIEEILGALKANLDIVPVTLGIHERAVALAAAHDLNFYDALIVAAALQSGCDRVVSEDLQNGQTFGSLKVQNPFR